MPRLSLVSIASACTAIACAMPAQAAENISLRVSWTMNVQNAGYIMARDKGFYGAEGLDVTLMPGGPNINSTTLVASGQNTFGTNDVSAVLYGNAQDMNLVMVGACFQKSPAGLLSLASSGIKTPKDLEGKTIAYNEGGPWHYTKAMLNKAGVDMSRVRTVVAVGNEVLMNGNVQAKTAFIVNEPIAVELQGHKTATLAAADYGVNAYAEVIFTTAKYVAEKPEVVRAFLRATAKGWDYALKNQPEAVAAVLKVNPTLNPEHQKRQLALQEGFVRSDYTAKTALCALEPAKVADSYQVLTTYGGLRTGMDPVKMVRADLAVPRP
jgi:ABC-type nitrate/sulfonate/bicarbonate transport system substrate-binding protein